MDLSIIIVNWNVKDLLYQCLQSVFAHTRGLTYEVIVVDNDSADGSREMLREVADQNEHLRVIANDTNAGFAQANNQGLRHARGAYVLFMNPDMEFVENTPRILHDYMQSHPQVSACTCRLQYPDGTLQPNIKRDPTFASQAWILYKLHHLARPKFLRRYLAKDFDYSREQVVEQVMGAFVFVRAGIMKKIGGWSPDYFLWWEDVDLCARLRRLHEIIMYVPHSRVTHHESQSFSQQMSLAKQRRFNRGMLTYFKKYHNPLAWLVLNVMTWDSFVLAWLVQVFKFKPKTQAKL